MDASLQSHAYISALLHKHRQIDARVAEIRSELRTILEGLPGSADIHRLIDQLKALYAALEQHFDEEELGGFIEDAISRNPKLAADADRLIAEHADLLRRLTGVFHGLNESIEALHAARKLVGEFNAFADALLSHEAFENHILEHGHNVAG